MGHGIAQVFALAGHDVTITDSVAGERSTAAKARITANLKDLGDDPRAVERVTAHRDLAAAVRDADYRRRGGARRICRSSRSCSPRSRRTSAPTRSSPATPRSSRSPTSWAASTRRERALGTHWWNPPYLVPLVEVIGTEWTSPAGDRLHHDAACRRRQDAGACEEGRAGLRRQPAAACALARGDCAGRARHLRRRDRRHGDQGELRPAARGARAAGERRPRRHRSDARDPPDRAAGYRAPAGPVALSRNSWSPTASSASNRARASATGRPSSRLRCGRRCVQHLKKARADDA